MLPVLPFWCPLSPFVTVAVDTFIGTRVERGDAEALALLSRLTGRSVSSEIRRAVRAHLEAAEGLLNDDEAAPTAPLATTTPAVQVPSESPA